MQQFGNSVNGALGTDINFPSFNFLIFGMLLILILPVAMGIATILKNVPKIKEWIMTLETSGLPALPLADSALALDPTTPTTLYAGTAGGGVFTSTTAGASWTAVNTGLTSLTVNAPTGQYDGTKLINVGTNRWAFKPEVGLSHPVGRSISSPAGRG